MRNSYCLFFHPPSSSAVPSEARTVVGAGCTCTHSVERIEACLPRRSRQHSLSDPVISPHCPIFEALTGCWGLSLSTGHRRAPVHPVGWSLQSPSWAGIARGFSFPSIPNTALSSCCSLGFDSLCSSPDGDLILWSAQTRGAVGEHGDSQ